MRATNSIRKAKLQVLELPVPRQGPIGRERSCLSVLTREVYGRTANEGRPISLGRVDSSQSGPNAAESRALIPFFTGQ